ncbi:MAG TPA: phospholipid carrier-dependent glycosyltransferase [Candidatus Dormibacteraeota bacterium]|nr:phospholipid carrier-dependent glycosyltransferase [Candidatus Dormibacteraeota bacterium]
MTETGGTAAETTAEAPDAAPRARRGLPLGPVPRPGARAFLELGRRDVIWLLVLIAVAFTVRVASPVFLDVLSPGSANKGVAAAWGVGYPLNNDGCIDDVPVGPNHAPKRVCGFVFDEVYFPVDAARDIAGVDYFDPEPPLAKLLMAPPIAVGGFNSGAWRTTTVLAGSLLVGLVYLIALRLRRGDRLFAVAAAAFVCFDGLAFVESRTGVIDIIAIMFAALLWYAFLLHWQARTRKQWTATLYFMALCAGLAFGAKLTALAPLAVAAVLIVGRFLEPTGMALVPQLARLRGRRGGEAMMWRDAAGQGRALGHYVLALVVAIVVFSACFSRYLSYEHTTVYHFDACTQEQGLHLASTDDLKPPWTQLGSVRVPNPITAERNILDFMAAGLQYHSAECHGHPYASDWYTWPVMLHPVLFYADYKSNTTPAGVAERGWISDMGNPAVWWLAIPALLFCLWKALGGRRGLNLLVAGAGVAGFAVLNIAAWGWGIPRLRYLGIPILVFGLWYALRRWWPVAVGALGLVALEEMITRYHAAPRFDLVRVDVGIGFKLAFAAMAVFAGLLVVQAVISRMFVPAFILLGYLAAWLMWVQGNERRVLFFYHMLGALLFMALALAYALSALRRQHLVIGGRRISMASLAYAGIAVVVLGFVFFYPVWTASPMTNSDFMTRMWVASWQ